MVLSRAAALPRAFGRSALRRAGSSTRSRSWRQSGRRGYASDHGHAEQQGSEIPWIIGSAAVTIPAAAWLWQQGPKSGGHGHDEHHEESEEKSEDQSDEGEESKDEESKEEGGDEESKDKGEDKDEGDDKEEGGDDKEQGGDEKQESKDEADSEKPGKQKEQSGKSERQMSEDGYELPGPNAPKQINWDSSSKKGPGEGQKGERSPSQKKGEKDAQGDYSGAKHPYIDDPEKSKKGVGVTETARIHGTVDSRAPSR